MGVGVVRKQLVRRIVDRYKPVSEQRRARRAEEEGEGGGGIRRTEERDNMIDESKINIKILIFQFYCVRISYAGSSFSRPRFSVYRNGF